MKKFITGALVFLFVATSGITTATGAVPVQQHTQTPETGQLIISDPNTGEAWTWNLPTTQLLIQRTAEAVDKPVQTAEVKVSIGEYLLKTMPKVTDTE